jgi:hexosaminidase
MLLLAVLPLRAVAQAGPPLMPLPERLTLEPGRLPLDSSFTATTTGYRDDRLHRALTRALERLSAEIGQPVRLDRASAPDDARLVLRVAGPGLAVQTPEEDESYHLVVSPRRIELDAPTVVGALRGLETLCQLVSADSTGYYLPAVRIDDRPRFRWRGLLLDVSRHFEPPDVIRRTLDGMAMVKLNVLHWHLSDDQGFRVESRHYSRLQRYGSDGGFYTQDDIRGIVAYARDRGIRVVPEFDMPGHATSWFVGYPQFASGPGPYQIERQFGVFDPAFDPTSEATYQFIDGFVAEMAVLFPDPYWHVGGDEVNGRQWNGNPHIVQFRKLHRLKDNDALQTWFNRRLARILTAHAKRMIGWDEILQPDLPRTAVIQSWRGTEYMGQAVRQGNAAILSAPYYLDHIDPADSHYLADPLPPENTLTPEQRALVLGGEACMWAEHVSRQTVDSRIWPRLAAIAERFWSPAGVRDVDDMYRRLSVVSIELERAGLGHEGHTDRMLRLLAGRRGIQPLQDLLSVTMPASFGQRSRIQGTTQLTPLTGLVDAARPDPWARSTLNRLARAVSADPTGSTAQRDQLARTFTSWQPLPQRVAELTDSVPLARDGLAAARALRQLGELGLKALDYLSAGGAPAAWPAQAKASLDTLARPQGLLRLAGVEAVRMLVDGVEAKR